MPRNPVIEALRQLHSVDSKIARLTNQKELLPISLRRVESHLVQQRQALEEKRARIKELRADVRSKEVTLRAAEEEINKLTVQLNTAKTNKEYAAFQHEIGGKKADGSLIEDQVLAAMADIEQLEDEARELERSVVQIEREHAQEAKDVESDMAGLDQQIEQLTRARRAATEKVEPEHLEEYERIAAKKGASALAQVVGNSCQGCFMQLPPQLGQVLRGGQKIVHCPSCSRLLYLP